MSSTVDVAESPNTPSIVRTESVSFSLVRCWWKRETNLLKNREAVLDCFGDRGRLDDIAVGVLAGKVFFRNGRRGTDRNGDHFEVVKIEKYLVPTYN